MSEPEAETASRPARTQDFLVDGRSPARVERPSDQDELGALLRDANSAGEAVILHGGRTGIEIGNPPSRYDLAIDLTALDQIVDLIPVGLGDLLVERAELICKHIVPVAGTQ